VRRCRRTPYQETQRARSPIPCLMPRRRWILHRSKCTLSSYRLRRAALRADFRTLLNHLLLARRTPELDLPVPIAAHNRSPVRRIGDRPTAGAVAREQDALLAGGGVDLAHAAVHSAHHQSAAIGGER